MWRRFAIRDRILRLDPAADCQQIVFLVGAYEYPWLIRKSLEFALFRSYAIPQISQLLDRTGQFRRHGQRRYDDTALLIAEIVENGYDSPRGRRAISTINRLHGKHSIDNDDMLYVLSTFLFEPIAWTEKYGWRPPMSIEVEASYHFWVEVGKRMQISEIPDSLEAFAKLKREYERENCAYHPANRHVADATIAILQTWYPRFMGRVVRWAVYALLDNELRLAFDYPMPPRMARWTLHGGLLLAAKIMRFLPARRRPNLLTRQKHRSHPSGYQVEELGPPSEN